MESVVTDGLDPRAGVDAEYASLGYARIHHLFDALSDIGATDIPQGL
jgi:hypothetical protein